VDGAQVFSQQAEAFAKQKESKHRQATQPERTMTVCDICGVFMNSTDNEARRRVSLSPLSVFFSFLPQQTFPFFSEVLISTLV
jgi:hypothetical protein